MYGNLDKDKKYPINEEGSPFQITEPNLAEMDMYIVSNIERLSDGETHESVRSRKLVTVSPLNFKAVKFIERNELPYKTKKVVKIHDSRKYAASLEKKKEKGETPETAETK